ncbi:hypothetical protein BH09MYX1_BH09MYX1_67590 [soil metagenome]
MSASRVALLGALFFGAFALAGCTPSIGDECQLSTDCSRTGDRLCDTSQPSGYCTLFNCQGDGCPAPSVCVQFAGTIPGCTYDDRRPSRVGRSMCLAPCDDDSDCRVGYVCRAPSVAPYGARILAADKSKKVCLFAPIVSSGTPPIQGGDAATNVSTSPPPVCAYAGPDLPAIDASAPTVDAGTDASDSGADASDASDAGTDASDGGAD